MPVLKIKKDGVWEEVGGSSPVNGGDADTLDGRHASDFALNEDVADAFLNAQKNFNDVSNEFNDFKETVYNDFNNAFGTLYGQVGNEFNNVYNKINSLNEKLGKTLTQHLTEEDMVLSSRQYGDKLPGEDGEPYTHVPGRIFFLRKVK